MRIGSQQREMIAAAVNGRFVNYYCGQTLLYVGACNAMNKKIKRLCDLGLLSWVNDDYQTVVATPAGQAVVEGGK